MLNKSIALLAFSSFAASMAAGTHPSTELWKDFFDAQQELRIKDSRSALTKIIDDSAARREWTEYALAYALIAGLENDRYEAVRILQTALDSTDSEIARIFIEARLARAFQQCAYSSNRWYARPVNDFEEVAGAPLPERLEEWSSTQLSAAAEQHYENVLAQSDRMKKIPIAAVLPKIKFSQDFVEDLPEIFKLNLVEKDDKFLLGIIALHDASSAEYPTLYDFIAEDAVKFFKELAFAKNEDVKSGIPEIPNADILFMPTQDFVANLPENSDDSAVLRSLQILGDWAKFHQNDADQSALARVTLARYTWADSSFEEKTVWSPEERILIESALKKFIRDYEFFPISAEASALLASLYMALDREPEAHEVVDKALAKFGSTKNASACKYALRELTRQTIYGKIPAVWNASAPTKFECEESNLKKIRFRAVPADWRNHLKKEYNRPNRLSKKEILALHDADNAIEWEIPFEQLHDFRSHKKSVEIPAGKLPAGFYFLFFAVNDVPFLDSESKDNPLRPKPIWVSDIAVVGNGNHSMAMAYNSGLSATKDGTLRLRVVNSLTGAPIEGATVYAWNKARWGGDRVSLPEVKTDALGEAVLTGMKRDRDPVILVEHTDAAGTQAVSIESVKFTSDSQKERGLITLLTDRSIYRPGQKISFKGILSKPITKAGEKPEVLPGKKATVKLISRTNGSEIAKTEVWSNGFGSFSGTLDIPADIGLGSYTVSAEAEGITATGKKRCSIEEYRRPKSEIFLKEDERPQALGGEVFATICGKSFTGTPLDGAKVSWHVREILPYVRHYEVRKNKDTEFRGEGVLDKNGELKIAWTAPHKNPTEDELEEQKSMTPSMRKQHDGNLSRTYEIEATIIDGNGELRTLSDFETFFNQADHLTGGPLSGINYSDGDIFVQAHLKSKVGAPVTFHLYADGKKVRSVEGVSVDFDSNKPSANLNADKTLAPGAYELVIEAKNALRQTITTSVTNEFVVVDRNAKTFPIDKPFLIRWNTDNDTADDSEFRVGGHVELLWGSNINGARAFVEVTCDDKRVSAFYTDEGRTQQIVRVPVTEEMRGGALKVSLTQLCNGTFHKTSNDRLVNRENTLKIESERIRTTLVPGTAEVWTFKVTREDGSPARDTEVLAQLYDISAESLTNGYGFSQGFSYALADMLSSRHFFQRNPISTAETSASIHGRIPQRGEIPEFRLPSWCCDVVRFLRPVAMKAGGRSMNYAAQSGELGEDWMDEAKPESAPSGLATGAGVDDDGGEEGSTGTNKSAGVFTTRKNLTETAFFYPFLQTNDNGIVTVQFVVPDALTRWKLGVFAHDKELRAGSLENEKIFTKKDLMAQPDAPRFLREGDEIRFPVKVSNSSADASTGKLKIEVDFLGADGKTVSSSEDGEEQEFSLDAKSSKTLFRDIIVPDGAVAMRYRATASSGEFADGEEGILPVLAREVVITESRTAMVRADSQATIEFDLIGKPGTKNAPRSLAFNIDTPKNAFDNVLLALPRLSAQAHDYESADSIFYRFYVNLIAKAICDKNPEIRETFELWRQTQPEKFESPLKAAPNSPFYKIGVRETEQRLAIADFFSPNKVDEEIRAAVNKLEEARDPANTGWSWMPKSTRGIDEGITLNILTGLGRLRERIATDNLAHIASSIHRLASGPLTALHSRMKERYKDEEKLSFGVDTAKYLYVSSLFAGDKRLAQPDAETLNRLLEKAKSPSVWTTLPRMSQAQVALALWRNGEKDVPAKIVESLRQNAKTDDALGMYWANAPYGLWLPQYAPIETQAMLIELFAEVAQDAKAVEEMKIWLLTQKQTHAWGSSRASADAVFALLTEIGDGSEKLEAAIPERVFQPADVKLTNTTAKPLKAGTQTPSASLAKISAKNNGDAPVFVSAHWTYAQPLGAVLADAPASGFNIKKEVFKRDKTSDGRTVLRPARLEILKPGDELVIRLTIKADRDFEYVCLKDMRGSGCENASQLSGWNWDSKLFYYTEPRDTETRFYFNNIPAGTYIFEYEQRVRTSGLYSGGFAEIRSLYAPEFSAHSSSESLVAM